MAAAACLWTRLVLLSSFEFSNNLRLAHNRFVLLKSREEVRGIGGESIYNSIITLLQTDKQPNYDLFTLYITIFRLCACLRKMVCVHTLAPLKS